MNTYYVLRSGEMLDVDSGSKLQKINQTTFQKFKKS